MPFSLEIPLHGKGHIHLIVALGGDGPPGLAGQIPVIAGLDALGTGAFGVGEADGLGRQGAVGVIPPGIGLQMDALGAAFFDVGADQSRRFPLDTGLDQMVAKALILRQLLHPEGIHLQDLSQGLGHIFNVRPGLLQLPGSDVYMLHRRRTGEDV